MATSVELQIIPFMDPRKANRQAAQWAEEIGDRASKALTGALADTQKKVDAAYVRTIRDALRLGRDADAKRIQSEFDQRERAIRVQAGQLKRIEEELSELREKGATDAEMKAAKVRKKALEDDIADRQDALEDLIKTQEKAQEKLVKQLDEGLDRAGKDFGESLEGAADKFEDLFAKALSADNLDPSELVKGLGSAIQGAAPTLLAGGGKMAAQGGAVGALGKAAVSLGSAAGLLAGVAASIGAVVAVLFAAYNQTKEFNKSILEGSSALDLLGSEGADSADRLAAKLGQVRQAAQQVALDFRATSEEVIGLSTAMNDAGLTFREQERLFGSHEEAMRMALVTTQAFGIGASESADVINNMSRDLGLAQDGIKSGFMDIFAAAQLSGMGVKNFFTSISEATSGLALYNFRLDDTLEILLGLEKIIGEDLAKTLVSDVSGQYKEMTFQDRLGAKMRMGGTAFREIMAGAQREAQASFGPEFQEALAALGGQRDTVLAALRNIAPDVFTAEGGVDIKKLGKTSAGQIGQLQDVLARAGDTGTAMRLGAMRRLGGGGLAGMGQFAASDALASKMVSALAYLGRTPIGEMTDVQKMALEQNEGITGSTLIALEDISNRIQARLEAGGATDVTSLDIAKAIQSGGLLTNDDRKVFEDAQKEGMTPMERIARNQLTETQSIFKTLQNMIVPLLEGIYNVIVGGDPEDLYRRADLKGKGFDKLTEDEKKSLGLVRRSVRSGVVVGTLGLDEVSGNAAQTQKVMEYLAKKEKGEADKRSDDVVDGLDELGQSIVDGFDLDARAGLASVLPTGTNVGDLTAADAAKMLKAGDVSPEERAAFIKAFGIEREGMLNDFMYRGGKVMSINTSDDFYGAKPGGAIDKALRGGAGGVTINNLTINESGNPQKTLEMVKQAIRAAKYA